MTHIRRGIRPAMPAAAEKHDEDRAELCFAEQDKADGKNRSHGDKIGELLQTEPAALL